MSRRFLHLSLFALLVVWSVLAHAADSPLLVRIGEELTYGPFRPVEFAVDGHGGIISDGTNLPGLNRNPPRPARAAALNWNGAEFLLAWSEQNSIDNGSRIRVALLDERGHLKAPGIIDLPLTQGHSRASTWSAYPEIAFDGVNFLVAWVEDSSLDQIITVAAARISASGAILDNEPLILLMISEGSLLGSPYTARPVVAWNGQLFLVVALDGVRSVSPQGEVSAFIEAFWNAKMQPSSRLIPNGPDVAWVGPVLAGATCTCGVHRGAWTVCACPLTYSYGNYFMIPFRSYQEFGAGTPLGATSGDTYLIVFRVATGVAPPSLLAVPFSRSGEPLSTALGKPLSLKVGSVGWPFNPLFNFDVASSGGEYVAAFESGTADLQRSIAVSVIDNIGVAQTPLEGLTISSGRNETEPLVAAAGPGRYLVVYRFTKDGQTYLGGRFVEVNPNPRPRAGHH